MILKDFIKPKWQSRDPETRRRAVEAMAPDEVELLGRLAAEDEAPAVRRAALARVTDPELIDRLLNQEADEATRQFAKERLRSLLAGTAADCPALGVRTGFLARTPAGELAEFVALNGIEPELRRSALEQVTREAVIRDAAIQDAVLANREAALARIADPENLEEIVRQTRKGDKQIHRQSKERLEAVRAAEQRRRFVLEEAEQLCLELESMCREGDWEEKLERLPGLDGRWAQVSGESGPGFQDRYPQARAAFMQASQPAREALEAEARERAAAVAGRESLLAQTEAQLEKLRAATALNGEEAAARAGEIEQLQRAWTATERGAPEAARALDQRFADAIRAIDERLKRLRETREREETLRSLLQEAERLSESKQPIIEKALKSLEQRWREEALPDEHELFGDLLKRLEEVDARLRKRLLHQRQQRETKVQALPEQIAELETLLAEKKVKESVPLHDRILSSINHLQALGVPRQQLRPHIDRLHRMDPQLLELRSWQAWAADDVRERLCAEMESMIGSELGPAELAVRIRHLRDEWNQLRSDGGAGLRTMRRRFDQAAEQAYAPCALHFQEQAKQRKGNLEKKQHLLEELEAFLASAEWSAMDWKEAVRFQRRITSGWRQAGPVDRRKSKEVHGTFDKRIELLNAHLATERKRNLEERNTLIDEVSALAEMEDINAAINRCKELQRAWRVTVPGNRKKENAVWQRFREACDAVFLRRKHREAAKHEAEAQHRAERLRLCEQAEALGTCAPDDLETATRQFHKIEGDWKALPRMPRRNADLDKRLESARTRFQAHARGLRREEVQSQLAHLKVKAGYCRELEKLLSVPDPASAKAAAEALDAAWGEANPLRDDDTERAIRARFEKAMDAVLEGGERREALLRELRENRELQERLCLRMEILCGVESPPEAREARLAFQADRLRKAISQGSEDPIGDIDEIERAWWLTAGEPTDGEMRLQARFEAACRVGRSR